MFTRINTDKFKRDKKNEMDIVNGRNEHDDDNW